MIDPPKPTSRQGKTSLWRYMLAFRKDILSAQPERLYRAWMAEFKTPFFRSYLINQPDLIRKVLKENPDDSFVYVLVQPTYSTQNKQSKQLGKNAVALCR